jgi:CRISPR-associated protein Csh1
MIEAIRNIGEYSLNKEGKSVDEPLDILIDDPKNRDTKNILFIVVENKNGEFEYRDIDVDEYSKDKLKKYLYKKGAPNGPDITPTAMVTTIDKTFHNKILGWFKKYNKLNNEEDSNFLVKIGDCLRDKANEILKDLEEKYNKESNIITLKINGKYVGDYTVFRSILLNGAKESFYFTKSFSGDNQYSRSHNQICSVCNQKREVYGFVNTYKFYTVDKPGFVSGGFQQRYAWKNYPVCLNCALILEEGRKYIGKSLNFNFYGFKYLLIPKFIKGISAELKKKVFRIIEDQKDPKFTKKEIARLTSDESEILQLMSEQGNYLNMNFLFYDAPKGYDGSVFNILLYIEDVLPSRLKRLFDLKKEIDNIGIFKRCMAPVFENGKRIGEEPLGFNFGVLRTFLSKISDNQTYNKYFLDIVNKIFSGRPISYHFIMSFIVKKIREDFINGYPTNISTLKGFMLLNYLNRLELLENFKEVKMVDESTFNTINISDEIKEKTDAFFAEFADFFNGSAKKGVFLEGVLTQYLLNIQYQERGATPFRVKLKGLNLDERQIKKLLPEIQNKLEEYGKNYYRELEKIISRYLVSAGNNWKMTNDEISYYFVLGMNLADLFKSENKETKEDKENG